MCADNPCLQADSVSNREAGFSYIEILVASFILAIAIVPAMQSLQTGILASGVHENLTQQHYRLIRRAEEVLADPFASLSIAAAAAGDKTTPSRYSDPAGSTDRVVVLLSYYDAGNSDGDADPFSILDPNTDGDADPYTGGDVDISLLWLRFEVEGSVLAIETLATR